MKILYTVVVPTLLNGVLVNLDVIADSQPIRGGTFGDILEVRVVGFDDQRKTCLNVDFFALTAKHQAAIIRQFPDIRYHIERFNPDKPLMLMDIDHLKEHLESHQTDPKDGVMIPLVGIWRGFSKDTLWDS